MFKIVIAEDHQVVRQGLKLFLETEADFRLVGEAGDGLEAMRLTERLKPDLLLLDLMLPGLHGLEVTRQLKSWGVITKVLVLSMNADEATILCAIENGADGYVLKSASGSELIAAMRKVLSGCRQFGNGILERAAMRPSRGGKKGVCDAYEILSKRERTVLQLTAEGLSNAEIAGRLFISPRTAETHRANLMEKLKVHSQTELVRFAIRKGIILA